MSMLKLILLLEGLVKLCLLLLYEHLQAAILVTTGYSYIGAQGDINIWNPKVESPDEFTTAQIWLKNGPGNAFESVSQAGW